MEQLVAVRRARPLGRETDDEALDVAPQMQQHALAGEIDRSDLNAVPRADEDERVVGQPADRLMDRRAAEAGDAPAGPGSRGSGPGLSSQLMIRSSIRS